MPSLTLPRDGTVITPQKGNNEGIKVEGKTLGEIPERTQLRTEFNLLRLLLNKPIEGAVVPDVSSQKSKIKEGMDLVTNTGIIGDKYTFLCWWGGFNTLCIVIQVYRQDMAS